METLPKLFCSTSTRDPTNFGFLPPHVANATLMLPQTLSDTAPRPTPSSQIQPLTMKLLMQMAVMYEEMSMKQQLLPDQSQQLG